MKSLVKFFIFGLVILAGVALLRPGLAAQGLTYAPASIQAWFGQSAAEPGKDAKKQKDGSSHAAGDDQRKGSGAIAVSVAAARSGTLPVVERTYGMLQSPAVVQLGSRITSQVTSINLKEGATVKAGDLLLTLDDRAPQAQLAKDKAALAKDQALLASATADLQRARTLVQKQAGTQQAFDQALAAQLAAQANVEADNAAIDADEVQLGFTRITAPIDGRLGSIPVSVGDLVTSGQNATTLMTVTQMKPLKVTFRLPESVLDSLRAEIAAGTQVNVGVIRMGETKPFVEGKLDFIDSSVDSASGTIGLSATIANEDLALWPGQHVNVEVERAPLSSQALIPTVALQPGQQGSFVWLLKDDSTVAPQVVTVERSEGGVSAISAGLHTGDKVVVEGQLRLAPGAKVKATEQAEKLADESSQQGTATP